MRGFSALLAVLAALAAAPVAESQARGFAILCVKQEQPRSGIVALDELLVEETPFLSEHQIVSYDWETHTIDVLPGVLRNHPEGREFLVVIGDLRLYRGHFTHLTSSAGYIGPVIDLPFLLRPDRTLARLPGRERRIRIRLWGGNVDGDPRFDKRLHDHLAAAGLFRDGGFRKP